ncbi:MAG TPA: D-arabinono-1,4-lactone oxidase [Mycobacteriales bacterium]|nr:D-arabinono-1,4-lactone oxidase [Mycobacteriales bacterium]
MAGTGRAGSRIAGRVAGRTAGRTAGRAVDRTARRAPGSWRNWSGDQQARPARVEVPRDVAEVSAAVGAAARDGLRVRMVGAGHSFTGAALTDGVLLRPDRLTGLVGVDTAARTATVRAGTRLRELNRLLGAHGLALENMGDIDRQTLAGALATGTHGTGLRYGGLATQIAALELVLADGSVVTCSPAEQPDLFAAAAVGLGAYGVVTAVTLRCAPAFTLRAVEEPAKLGDLLGGRFAALAETDEHVEFYWFPHTDDCVLKRNNRLRPGEPVQPLRRWRRLLDDEILSNGVFKLTCALGRRAPAVIPRVNRLATGLLGTRTYTAASHRVFTSPRRVRFREMEYALPRAGIPAALRELDGLIRRRGWRISFPVEVRVAAPDGLWLSTAHGRETGYVAVHQYVRTPHQEYFEAVESIMLAAGGRPHWGKLHNLDAAGLAPRYPRFADAVALRDSVDPERRFGNAYVDRVLTTPS